MPPKPRVKIPVHVAVYTIAFIPGAVYAYYWYKNAPTDEEMEKELRKNYSHNIQANKDKHAQMNAFLQNMKDPNSDHQKRMDQVLLGGRGQQKRLYAVDEDIYGTEEGAKLQQEAQAKANNTSKKRKRRKKKKNAKKNDIIDDTVVENNGDGTSSVKQSVTAVAAVGVVGALAAVGASILLGGKRSQ